MKSRVLQIKDYREVDITPLLKPFVPDEAALETELRRLTNPYVRWETGETAYNRWALCPSENCRGM